jgi:hypothetical protein
MKGEDEAAETFESNLQLITNEMKSRYGDNADAMIDAWIVAQSQGRGLEATAEGAEFMAMLGPAGAVLDQMARSGEAIDPATFKLFDDKLKESVGAYDTQNYALLAKQKESLNMAANMLMYGRDTSKESRAMWAEDIKQKAAVNKAGETVLKANEAMVEITTNLQAGLVGITTALVGPEGSLSTQLHKAIGSVKQFSDAISLFAKGKPGDAAEKVAEMLADNPLQFLLGAGMSIPGLPALAAGILGLSTLGSADQDKLARTAADANIKKDWDKAGNRSIKIKGGDTYSEGQKFKHQGTEYKVVNGKPEVTKAGLRAIKGGVKGGAYKGIRGSTASGIFSMVSAIGQGHEAYSAEKDRYADIAKPTQAQEDEHEKILGQIVTNAIAKGGGGILGGAAMGAIMGIMTANPILLMLATGAGAIAGYNTMDAATAPDDPEFNEMMGRVQKKTDAERSLSSEEIRTRYVAQAKLAAAQTDPSYLKLEAIRKLLEIQGGAIDTTAAATSSNAISAQKVATNNQGKPGANVSYVT